MNRELKTLQCFLYDNDVTDSIMGKIITFLNEMDMRNVVIQKDWVQGFHLNLTWEAEEYSAAIEQFISTLMANHQSNYVEQDYRRFTVMVETLKKMEDYPGEVLPLIKDGEVRSITSANLLKNNPLCGVEANYQVEQLKTEVLRRLYFHWMNYSVDQQNIEIMKAFFISSQLSPGGIRYGYLSLRSNFEYFKQQLTELKNKDRADALHSVIHTHSDMEKSFVQNGVEQFLEGGFDKEPIVQNMRYLIERLQQIYFEAFDAGEIYTQNMHFGDDFLERHSNVSEFHESFFTNAEFLEQYRSKEFIVYRFIASNIYSLLPLLNISPVRKQKITGMVADSVESHFSTDWRTVYKDMARKLEA